MEYHNQDVQTVLHELNLPGLQIIADEKDIAALEGNPACRITFLEALRLALEAFMSDSRGSEQGHDSAFDVIRSAPDGFGLGATPSDAEIREALRKVLADDPRAQVVLLTPTTIKEEKYRFQPEYGESIADNWVFRIIAPANWPFLQWSVVDIRGETPAYSYEFD